MRRLGLAKNGVGSPVTTEIGLLPATGVRHVAVTHLSLLRCVSHGTVGPMGAVLHGGPARQIITIITEVEVSAIGRPIGRQVLREEEVRVATTVGRAVGYEKESRIVFETAIGRERPAPR